MAGIEKICEFSDEYPGHLMYGYKKNLIQIMPQFRKLFRGAAAELHIEKAEVVMYKRFRGCGGGYSTPCARNIVWGHDGDLQWYLDYEFYYGSKLRINYTYTLKVGNQELKGTVDGKYLNWSFDISTVKRKLRRMVGPHLKIVNHVGTRAEILREWRKDMLAEIAVELNEEKKRQAEEAENGHK